MGPRKRRTQAGGLLVTALVTLSVTALVGTSLGLTFVLQGGGCSEAYTNAGEASAEDLERCRQALPRQLEVAGAGANFIPSGANETLATQLIAAGVEEASRPVPIEDAALPPAVEFAARGYPGMLHCRIDDHGLYPYATGICYAYSGDSAADLPTECASERGAAGSGPCPGDAASGACLRESSSGSFNQWVEYGIGSGRSVESRDNCSSATRSTAYSYPYRP